MNARIEQEVALLRQRWPDLEHAANPSGHWVRLPSYPVPAGWSADVVEVAFRVPTEAAVQPYGFYVRPGLMVTANGGQAVPSNYTSPAQEQPPFDGEPWSMFSWSPQNGWQPTEPVADGDNMTHFARSFADRLKEPS